MAGAADGGATVEQGLRRALPGGQEDEQGGDALGAGEPAVARCG